MGVVALSARGRDGDKWYAGDNVILAIGQGNMLATPLQMADSYATFSQRGTGYRPNLVLRVLKPGGDPNDPAAVVRTIEPVVNSKFDMPAAYADPIQQGLSGVTSDKDGTATPLFEGFDQNAWPLFGKTGTAQVNGKADNSLFVGVGPTTNPQYVGVAVLEESGFGADAAGPVVRSIFEKVSGQDRKPDPCAPPVPGAPATSSTTTTTTTTRPNTPPTTCPPGTGANATTATSTPSSQVPAVPPTGYPSTATTASTINRTSIYPTTTTTATTKAPVPTSRTPVTQAPTTVATVAKSTTTVRPATTATTVKNSP